MGGLGSITLGGKRLGCWRGLYRTGDLTSSIGVLRITPLILISKKKRIWALFGLLFVIFKIED